MEPNPKKEVKSDIPVDDLKNVKLGDTIPPKESTGELIIEEKLGQEAKELGLDKVVKTKQCLQCKIDKPLSEFYKERIQCKQCMKDDYTRYQDLHTLQPEIRRQKLIDLLQEAVNKGKQIADQPVGYNTEEWVERIIGFFSKSREEY